MSLLFIFALKVVREKLNTQLTEKHRDLSQSCTTIVMDKLQNFLFTCIEPQEMQREMVSGVFGNFGIQESKSAEANREGEHTGLLGKVFGDKVKRGIESIKSASRVEIHQE